MRHYSFTAYNVKLDSRSSGSTCEVQGEVGLKRLTSLDLILIGEVFVASAIRYVSIHGHLLSPTHLKILPLNQPKRCKKDDFVESLSFVFP